VDSISRRLVFAMVTGLLGLVLLMSSRPAQVRAQQPAQRPTITATIVLRESDKVTLNRGSQDGLRKGDTLKVSHFVNGRYFVTGTVVVTKVYGTTAIAKITDQSGALGPEDTATFEDTTPAPVAPARKPATEPARKSVPEPVATAPTAGPTPAQAGKTAPTSSPLLPTELTHKIDVPLPLLPEFSGDKAGGASFSLDFTNEGEKVIDTSAYRLSARLILDGQDYRTIKPTLTGNYNLAPGKVRSFSFSLSDFTVASDKDVWPLKSGRHTVTIRFGGNQYGPLTFEWRGDNVAK
jgi:hypothetical protein